MTAFVPGEPLSVKTAKSVISRYGPAQMQWHYEHGLVLQSIYAAGTQYAIPGFASWVKSMYDAEVADDGTIRSYREENYNLDMINPGKHLFDLYQDTGEKKYRTALETLRAQLRRQPRTHSGGFWHKKIYPWQMWLDGLYMAQPFYARYAATFGTDADFDDIASQFELAFLHTKDRETGLLYHAWDESRKQLWSDPDTGCSPHFWGRAMGWYCMAVLDVLDWFPETDSERKQKLVETAVSLVTPILAFQDCESGLWYQVMNMPEREKNYLETSASAMFVRFLFKIQRKGYLPGKTDQQTVLQAAQKGYKGLCSRLSEDEAGQLHLAGICSVAGLGGNPYRDGSYGYYVGEPVVSDDFKGIGPFIFASLEAEMATEHESEKKIRN